MRVGRREAEEASGTQIVMVTNDAALERIVEETLAREGSSVSHAADGAEAMRHWRRRRPDLAVIDGALPGIDGYAVVERIREVEGAASQRAQGSAVRVPILLLATQDGADQKIRALRVGADDVLAKPFHPEEFAARVRSLLARYSTPKAEPAAVRVRRGKLFVFYGAKGGVGTTTIAINVAIALRRGLHRRVALVDGKLQFGDHRIVLDFGMDKRSIADMLDAPAVDSELVQKVMVEHGSGIDALLAPAKPEVAERITPDFVTQVLAELLAVYDEVIVDIDQRMDEHNLRILEMADAIFVVTISDIMSLKNVGQIFETIERMGQGAGKTRLVLNRANAFTGVTAASAEAALRRRIDYELPNEYAGAISALNSGAPIMLSHANTAIGRALMAFAQAIDAIPSTSPATGRAMMQPALAR